MDCIVDFCIGCDKTAVDGFYCSEQCRLADLEKSNSSPSSPSHSHGPHPNPFHAGIFHTKFHQPPSQFPPPPTKTLSLGDLQSERSGRCSHGKKDSTAPSPQRDLSPASSRWSVVTTPMEPEIEDTTKELMNYFNAFDRTRELRRKAVPGTRLPHAPERPRQHSH